MQERIDFLKNNNMDTYSDPQLLENYELHAQIQQCLLQDHTDQYLLIAGIISAVSLFVYIRWRMIKASSKKNRVL